MSSSLARTGKSALGSSGRLQDSTLPELADNPFRLPSDEEVFRIREEEKKAKLQNKHSQRQAKVWEKTTASSRIGRTTRTKDDDIPMAELTAKQMRAAKGLVSAATAALSQDRRREKENMSDFIAKKREMFLVQMALDTKREEIQKLEQKAHMKEEALQKSELMLEEDAIRFDAFLKENDRQSYEAVQRAENMTKLKNEKLHEIKKLKHQISVLTAEKGKCNEQLQDCMKYKEFLDRLTPVEWVRAQEADQNRRRAQRKQQRHAVKLVEWEKELEKRCKAQTALEDDEKRAALREGRVYKPPKQPVEERVRTEMRPIPKLENEDTDYSSEELPMYFTKPQQLLDIFTELEESNLFLIQNNQETEQQLEELRQLHKDTEKSLNKQTESLDENIRALKQEIANEQSRAEALRERVHESDSQDPQLKLLDVLTSRVREVYAECVEPDGNPPILTMLTALEAKLEHLLSEMAGFKESYVVEAEREKESERREKVRKDRMEAQKEAYELRLKRSMERSQAPVKRKVGKQLMFRSAPIKRKVKKEKRDPQKEQEERDRVFLE